MVSSSFVEERSTQDAIVRLTAELQFTVNHLQQIETLDRVGVRGVSLRVKLPFESYLSNQQQSVKEQNINNDQLPVE